MTILRLSKAGKSPATTIVMTGIKKITNLLRVILLGMTILCLTACDQTIEQKIAAEKHLEMESVTRVIKQMGAALDSSVDQQNSVVDSEAYAAALKKIDVIGCPPKFVLVWKDYIEEVQRQRPGYVQQAGLRLKEVANEVGAKFAD